MPTVSPDKTITLSFSVTDRNRTIEWYERHFGFEHLYSVDEAGWSEISTNTEGVTIGLGDADSVQHGNCVPVFGVPSLDDARSALEAADVAFDGETIVMEGMVKIATLFDPDQNAMMIAEDLT